MGGGGIPDDEWLKWGDPVEPAAFVVRVRSRGWPAVARPLPQNKRNRRQRRNGAAWPAQVRSQRGISAGRSRKAASTLPPVQRKTARVFSPSSRGLRTCARSEKGSSASDATEKGGSQKQQIPLFYIPGKLFGNLFYIGCLGFSASPRLILTFTIYKTRASTRFWEYQYNTMSGTKCKLHDHAFKNKQVVNSFLSLRSSSIRGGSPFMGATTFSSVSTVAWNVQTKY